MIISAKTLYGKFPGRIEQALSVLEREINRQLDVYVVEPSDGLFQINIDVTKLQVPLDGKSKVFGLLRQKCVDTGWAIENLRFDTSRIDDHFMRFSLRALGDNTKGETILNHEGNT